MDQFRTGSHTAVAVHDPSNMFYLTEGYTGEGVVYLSEHSRVIITDFRYTEQAERQAPGFRVEMTEKGRSQNKILAELIKPFRDFLGNHGFLRLSAYQSG